jgi:ferredoxin-type protein NapF
MPLSRRALFSAFLPSASADGSAASDAGEAPDLRRLATISTTNICVERHGVSCRRCAEVCDHTAIRILARERRGAVIDAAACTGCGDCVPACPVAAITLAATG